MSMQSSTQSRAAFQIACRDAIQTLMREHGYSRERAVAALLLELVGECQHSNDQEIFSIMLKHNLGLHQASHAWMVAQAVREYGRGQNHKDSGCVDGLLDLWTHKLRNIRPNSMERECSSFVSPTMNTVSVMTPLLSISATQKTVRATTPQPTSTMERRFTSTKTNNTSSKKVKISNTSKVSAIPQQILSRPPRTSSSTEAPSSKKVEYEQQKRIVSSATTTATNVTSTSGVTKRKTSEEVLESSHVASTPTKRARRTSSIASNGGGNSNCINTSKPSSALG